MEVHGGGAEQAKAAGDYKAMPAFTVPALDRAMPRKQDAAAQTQIAIVLSPQQLSGFTDYSVPEVKTELLEAPLDDAS